MCRPPMPRPLAPALSSDDHLLRPGRPCPRVQKSHHPRLAARATRLMSHLVACYSESFIGHPFCSSKQSVLPGSPALLSDRRRAGFQIARDGSPCSHKPASQPHLEWILPSLPVLHPSLGVRPRIGARRSVFHTLTVSSGCSIFLPTPTPQLLPSARTAETPCRGWCGGSRPTRLRPGGCLRGCVNRSWAICWLS